MTWNADPLEVQAGAVADGKSRMLLKTTRALTRPRGFESHALRLIPEDCYPV